MKDAQYRAETLDTVAWRIDALDARSGVAFASYRTGLPLFVPEALTITDTPTAYISAPDFEVEWLTNSAVGFAATRSSFQLGLFIGDNLEIGWKGLDELVEFVRRCYVAGAGGDDNGTGELGFEMPPAPGEDPAAGTKDDPFPPLQSTEAPSPAIDEFIAVLREAHDWIGQSQVDPVCTSHRVSFAENVADLRGKAASELIVDAAHCLLEEILRRYKENSSASIQFRWGQAAMALDRVLLHLRLKGENQIDERWKSMSKLIRKLYPNENWRFPYRHHSMSYEKSMVLTSDLNAIPVPQRLAKVFNLPNPKTTTIQDLLTGLLATPTQLITPLVHSRDRDLCLRIALLATEHIVLGTADSTADIISKMKDKLTKQQQDELEEQATQFRSALWAHGAWTWLLNQLPVLFFPEKIEEIIRLMPNQRYQSGPTNGGEQPPDGGKGGGGNVRPPPETYTPPSRPPKAKLKFSPEGRSSTPEREIPRELAQY